MADPRALYHEAIFDHNGKSRNYGTLAHTSHQASGHNPLCGDHIEMALNLGGECIDQHHVSRCIVRNLQGVGVDDDGGRQGQDPRGCGNANPGFLAMVTGKLDLDSPNHIGRLAVFAGVCDLPTRVKCAILP